MSSRIGLVGCVKEKRDRAAPAADLYTSTLFVGRRRYVERSCDEWWILSAEHGLVSPTDVLEPYDVTLNDASRSERRRWAAMVLRQIDERIRLERADVIECHAGANYLDFGLADGLLRRECILDNPTAGLAIGRQLQFYSASS
jgi:hypothetical protein